MDFNLEAFAASIAVGAMALIGLVSLYVLFFRPTSFKLPDVSSDSYKGIITSGIAALCLVLGLLADDYGRFYEKRVMPYLYPFDFYDETMVLVAGYQDISKDKQYADADHADRMQNATSLAMSYAKLGIPTHLVPQNPFSLDFEELIKNETLYSALEARSEQSALEARLEQQQQPPPPDSGVNNHFSLYTLHSAYIGGLLDVYKKVFSLIYPSPTSSPKQFEDLNRIARDLHYETKNRVFQNDNYYDELTTIEARFRIARSIAVIAGLLLWLIYIVILPLKIIRFITRIFSRRTVQAEVSRRSWAAFKRYGALTLFATALLVCIHSMAAFAFSQAQRAYFGRVFGYYRTMYQQELEKPASSGLNDQRTKQ